MQNSDLGYCAPNSIEEGIMKWWPVSVCPSVCRVPRPNSRAYKVINPKLAQDGSPSHVKGQGHQAINAVTDNAPYACRREFSWRKGESGSIFH